MPDLFDRQPHIESDFLDALKVHFLRHQHVQRQVVQPRFWRGLAMLVAWGWLLAALWLTL